MRGLIGKNLSHSYSKIIHESIDGLDYNLIQLDELDSFFASKDFQALNVTIPYKNDVIQYLDKITEVVEITGSVNTIRNNNGTLEGYNTDYDGLKFLLDYHNIHLENKVIGILGNGATSRTIALLSQHSKASNILVFARNPKDNEHKLSDKDTLSKVEVLFNATPNGMYPDNMAIPLVNVELLKNLSAVVDLVYNPLYTKLILDAKNNNIKAVNGLMMLVHQAVVANEIFYNVKHDKSVTIDLYKKILLDTLNIVLIGMPMSGKSYYSREISALYNKELIDIDHYIEDKEGMSIANIFETQGEEAFRLIEANSIKEISKGLNLAISTGGGVVLNDANMNILKQNSIIIFLDMPLELLKNCNPKGRPLLKDPKNIEKLYNERYNLYTKYCDKRVVKRGFKRQDTLKKIEVSIHEYLNT